MLEGYFLAKGEMGLGMAEDGRAWMDGQMGLEKEQERSTLQEFKERAARELKKAYMSSGSGREPLSPQLFISRARLSPLPGRRRGIERAGGHVAQCPGGCRWGGPGG